VVFRGCSQPCHSVAARDSRVDGVDDPKASEAVPIGLSRRPGGLLVLPPVAASPMLSSEAQVAVAAAQAAIQRRSVAGCRTLCPSLSKSRSTMRAKCQARRSGSPRRCAPIPPGAYTPVGRLPTRPLGRRAGQGVRHFVRASSETVTWSFETRTGGLVDSVRSGAEADARNDSMMPAMSRARRPGSTAPRRKGGRRVAWDLGHAPAAKGRRNTSPDEAAAAHRSCGWSHLLASVCSRPNGVIRIRDLRAGGHLALLCARRVR
jgi:hypothetical protein